MPFPLIPVALGAGALWAISKMRSGSTSSPGSSSGPTVVRIDQAVAAAMARETDPARLIAFASALQSAGYQVEAAELFGKAAAMTALQAQQAQQQSQQNLLVKGISALKQGGY